MKRIFAIFLVSLLLTSMVSASSLHGNYNGKPIIKVVSNGQELQVKDAPAVLMDERTMVPIYMLRELGATVGWDQNTQTVSVEINGTSQSQRPSQQQSDNIVNLTKDIIARGGLGVTLMELDGSMTATTSYPAFSSGDANLDNVIGILFILSRLDTEYSRVNYFSGEYVEAQTKDLKDLLSGKIAEDQFMNKLIIGNPQSSDTSNQTPVISNASTVPELYSNDGKTFLGLLTTNSYHSDSIYNEYGTYGGAYSTNSIWNKYGTYGSQYSSESAFSDYATTPPIIVLNGEIIGYLTTNKFMQNSISPLNLKSWLEHNNY